jgi:hypothetical protein
MKNEATSKRMKIGAPSTVSACFDSRAILNPQSSIGAPVSDPACFDSHAILHPPSSIFAFMLAGRSCRTASFYPMPARGLCCNRPVQTQNSNSGNIWSDLVTLSHFRSGFGQVLVKFWSSFVSQVAQIGNLPCRRMVFGISSPVK